MLVKGTGFQFAQVLGISCQDHLGTQRHLKNWGFVTLGFSVLDHLQDGYGPSFPLAMASSFGLQLELHDPTALFKGTHRTIRE